jgi:OmpA-OmpF porin, OOP family
MRKRLIAGALLLTFVSACSARKPWGSGAVGGGIVGAALGGVAGGAIANNLHEFEKEDHDRAAGIGIGVVTGGLLGALLGHALFGKQEFSAAPAPAPAAQPPAPTKKKIVLRGVNFDFNKADIRKDAAPILDEAANILKDNKDVRVSVQGHTDAVGSDAYNMKLSMRRADSVKRYLAGKGVAADRLATEGFGESKPVASNDTADGRAQNRRVELVP